MKIFIMANLHNLKSTSVWDGFFQTHFFHFIYTLKSIFKLVPHFFAPRNAHASFENIYVYINLPFQI